MTTPHLPYWLAALHLPEVGPRTVMRWLEVFPDIKSVFTASSDDLIAAGLQAKHVTALKKPDWHAVDAALTWAQVSNQTLMTMADDAYPALLKQIYDPPIVLYIRGDVAALSTPQIAIVGSRNATPAGLKNAEQFAYHLAQNKLTITSGLALGIDGAAHRAALAAAGVTLAVMGTGLNHIYPASHRSLAEEIVANRGVVISEFPLHTMPRQLNFPRRNRVISGLSIGVLVIEAALKSGSLITARHALEQGREVFAIPGSIHNPLARGCHHLIRQGAKLVETATHIVEELGALYAAIPPPSNINHLNLNENLKKPEQFLLAQIGYEITPIDVIILRSRLTTDEVSPILLTLELQGLISSVPGGYIRAQ